MPDDTGLRRQLGALLSAGAAVSADEAMARVSARQSGRSSPTRARARPRVVSVATLAAAVLVLGGAITAAVVSSARHTGGAGTGVSSATPLADSSLVASGLTLPLDISGGQPTAHGPALVAYEGSGRRELVADVPDPYGPWQSEFGTAVTGGDAVVVENLTPAGSDRDDGTAVAVRPGTSWQQALGPATQVFAGAQAGTVWIWTAYGSSHSSTDCTIREVSVDGAVLLQPVRVSCSWTVLGIVDGGLVVAPYGFAAVKDSVETWDPLTRTASHRFDLPDASGADIAHGLAATSASNFRHDEGTDEVFIADFATARYQAIKLRAAVGMAFPFYSAGVLSPNGRYLAIEETTLAYDLEQEKIAADRGPMPQGACPVVQCAAPVMGLLAVFDVATGNLVFQRKLSFLSSPESSLAWSPDGSWLFMTASNRTIGVVPTFSTAVPIHLIGLTGSAGVGSVGNDHFVVVGR